MKTGKRTHHIKLMADDQLYCQLCHLADQQDKAVSDYVHSLVWQAINGIGYKIDGVCDDLNKTRSDHQ